MPADVECTVEQRIVEAAALLHGWGGITGWAGLRWLGCAWTACGSRRQCGASALRCDGAGSALEAAKTFARASYGDLVSIAELVDFTERELNGKTGVAKVRDSWPLLTENAWSPMEVEMYHHWTVLAGCPPPLVNVPVFDLAGRHLATPDLLDPVTGVAGEYAGAVHVCRRCATTTSVATGSCVGPGSIRSPWSRRIASSRTPSCTGSTMRTPGRPASRPAA